MRVFKGTAAQRAASTKAGSAGDLAVETDTGNLAIADGSSLLGALKRLVRVDEVTTAVATAIVSAVQNANAQALPFESGYAWAVQGSGGRVPLGVTPDGTTIIGKLMLRAGAIAFAALDTDTQSRLVGPGIGAQLQALGVESLNGLLPITDAAGHLLSFYDAATGAFVPTRVVLPAGSVGVSQLSSAVLSGLLQPNPIESGWALAITDSTGKVLAGLDARGYLAAAHTTFPTYSSRAAENPAYIAHPLADSNGRQQIRVTRRSDAQVTISTSDAWNSVEPTLTEDNKLLYRHDGSGTMAGYWRAADGTGQTWSLVSRLPIYCPGDSLTQGAGAASANNQYPAVLGATLGVTVLNDGIGGQGIESISARSNADPALLTVTGNQIPAGDGSATVTVTACVLTSTGAAVFPLGGPTAGSAVSRTGTLNGVHGTLTDANDTGHTLTFKPDAGTASKACPAGTAFVFDLELPYEDATWSIYMGRNSFKIRTPAAIVNEVQLNVARIKSFVKRYVVLEIVPFAGGDESGQGSAAKGSSYDQLVAANNALAAAFPTNFVPIAQYLRSNQAAIDAGITYSTQDLADIANGLTPSVFRSDNGHLNDISYPLVGRYVAAFMRAKGWYA